jgi:archaellum biogenesis ATPase FlaH
MTPDRIEHIIISELLHNPEYGKRYIRFLKPEYFLIKTESLIVFHIKEHILKYDVQPSLEQLVIAIHDGPGLGGIDLEECDALVSSFFDELPNPRTPDWMQDQTESFIREQGTHVAIVDAISTLDGKGKVDLPTALETAIKAYQFSLDDAPGLSLEWEPLFDSLQSPSEKFPFGINILNEMTCGGPTRKTVTVIVAPTNTGKSLILCHQTAEYLRQGKNVVYITLEMADRKVLKRIYANLLNTDINQLDQWTRERWQRSIDGLGVLGKLKIREYASRTAHAGHFAQYLDELKQREGFVPDVIVVDYLNECLSRTMRYSKNVSLYQYVGSIASELRAIATEHNAVLLTATQTNRDGYAGDPDLKNTSESAQINSGADLIIGVNKDEHFSNKLRFRVLKNRDGEMRDRVFLVGVNRAKMRLYDIDDSLHTREEVQEKREAISKRKSAKPGFLKS